MDVINVLIGVKSLDSVSSSVTDFQCDLELLTFFIPFPQLYNPDKNNSSPLTFVL